MVYQTFRRSNLGILLPNAPQVPPQLIQPFVAEVPPVDAYWRFGADNPGLVDSNGLNPLQRTIRPTGSGGTGYSTVTPPTVVITGANGVTASAIGVVQAGVVSLWVVLNPGIGITSPLTTAITHNGGSGATCSAGLQGAATVGANSITTASGALAGLITPFVDSLDQTIIVVVKLNLTDDQMLCGVLTSSSSAAIGGDGLFFQSPNFQATTRTAAAAASATVALPAGLVAGQIVMMSITQSQALGQRTATIWKAGVPVVSVATAIKLAASPPRRIAFGSGYYATGFPGQIEFYNAAIKMSAMSMVDVGSTYRVIFNENLARGVTIA